MAKFASLSEAKAAKIRAQNATAAERQAQSELLAMMANSRLKPRKEQAGHAETPLFQTTIEEFC